MEMTTEFIYRHTIEDSLFSWTMALLGLEVDDGYSIGGVAVRSIGASHSASKWVAKRVAE